MRRTRIVWWVVPLVLLLLCGPAGTQEESAPESQEKAEGSESPVAATRAPQPGDETRVFVLEHAIPRVLAEVLEVFPATIAYSRFGPQPQPALAVSASPAVMAAIAETIERLDRPSKPARGVELTAYIVEAVSDSDDIDVPPILEPVVAQLRETLRYQGYRTIDSLIARTTEGSNAVIKGVTRSSPPRPAFSYTMVERGIAITSRSDGSKSVLVEQLRFTASTRQFGPPDPTSGADFQAEISASLEIGEGQQVVVGKAGMGDSGNALILVLSARVTD